MKKSIGLIAAITLLGAACATAATWVECGTTNPRHASCTSDIAGSSCTYTDDQGISRTGSVRVCPPCTGPNGKSLGLTGSYCFSTEAAPAPICPGGKAILRDGSLVGCVHQKLDTSQRTGCEGLEILRPNRALGNCWVCIEEELTHLVLAKGSWSQLEMEDEPGRAVAADFSCLGRHRRVDEQTRPAPSTGIAVRPGLTSPSPSGTWTAWLNRDGAGGSGDYETLSDFVKAGTVCAQPTKIECRTADGRPWQEAGQEYVCSPDKGGICRNDGQSCLDYQVRFLCP